MALKRYQERVVREVTIFLEVLGAQQAAGNTRHAAQDAWDDVRTQLPIPSSYLARQNGLGKDLPTFCVKVPTGGGKTLLAAEILGVIHKTILKARNGTGLVLWVVPSDQIYKDTLRTLRDRRHQNRESLEFSLSRRIEVWEKHEIARLTPAQLHTGLNILVLKLASTNRESREQLKFFRDSGGNIVLHFPAEEQSEHHKALKAKLPNLDMLAEDLVATSLANLVRLSEPAVILDEGHKATSDLARRTIEGFNASIVVELSATPPRDANVLVRVSGMELLDEQMIKLPINVANSNQKSWKECLTQARDRRNELAKQADQDFKKSGRSIRPIVLVQVERTGKDQRGAGLVHSEDVKAHLLRLGLSESAIAIKSSEKDDIEGIDLLAEGCPVEWIITKSALQEGWDCPFAYVLVSLNNTGSQQSMTQLVGRVLRQPYAERTEFQELNESYVYCLRRKAADITREVKKALEQEGYEGDATSVVDRSDPKGRTAEQAQPSIRKKFLGYYRKPFEGKIYLPRFCVKQGSRYEGLDYFRHLVSHVDVEMFDYDSVDWDLSKTLLASASESFYRLTLGQDSVEPVEERAATILETDDQVKAWLVASVSFDQYSHKQLRAIVEHAAARLYEKTAGLHGRLGLVKFPALEKIAGLVERETDRQTQQTFEKLHTEGRLCFYLDCIEGRFEIPRQIPVRTTRKLVHDNNDPVQRSLFDWVPDDLNEYEKSVALFLDNHPQVLWWYRNLVGSRHFSIQGYRRNRVYPDFVVQQGRRDKPTAAVVVVESKGKHLKGNEDTNYKRSVARYFGKVGRKVTWQKLGQGFEDETFRFHILDEGEYEDRDWRDDLKKFLEEPATYDTE